MVSKKKRGVKTLMPWRGRCWRWRKWAYGSADQLTGNNAPSYVRIQVSAQ